MDNERQIRFLYPPLLVVLYFLLGWLSDCQGRQELECLVKELTELGALYGLFASGSVILVVGFVLGTVTYLLLRLFARVLDSETHEIPCDTEMREAIWRATGSDTGLPKNDYLLMAGVWIDFVHCKDGVHEWIVRRWNAFNTSANIVVGVVIVLPWGSAIWRERDIPPIWYCLGFFLIGGFLINALIAYSETMRMIRFAAQKVSTAPPSGGSCAP